MDHHPRHQDEHTRQQRHSPGQSVDGGEEFGAVYLHHQEPGRVGNRLDNGQNGYPLVIPSLHQSAPPLGRHRRPHGRQVSALQGKTQHARQIGLPGEAGEEHHLLPLPPHQQCLPTPGRHGPGMQERLQTGTRSDTEIHHPRRSAFRSQKGGENIQLHRTTFALLQMEIREQHLLRLRRMPRECRLMFPHYPPSRADPEPHTSLRVHEQHGEIVQVRAVRLHQGFQFLPRRTGRSTRLQPARHRLSQEHVPRQRPCAALALRQPVIEAVELEFGDGMQFPLPLMAQGAALEGVGGITDGGDGSHQPKKYRLRHPGARPTAARCLHRGIEGVEGLQPCGTEGLTQ